MKDIFTGIIFLGLYLPLFSQQTPSSVDMDAIWKKVQHQTDSIMNSPKMKKMISDGRAVNTDSIIRAAKARTGNGMNGKMAGYSGVTGGMAGRPDTTVDKIPPKNTKSLGALPPKALSDAALSQYITDLEKKIIPAFQKTFGTPVPNVSKYSATTVSNASAIAAEMGFLDQAVVIALKGLEIEPGNQLLLNNAAVALHQGGLETAAIPLLEAAEKKSPGNSTVENNLGQSYLSLGDKEKAMEYLQAAISKAPNHPLANSSMALIYLDKGDRSSALRCVENSMRGSFTDKAYHLLYKLKQDPVLMDYFKQRYKQPEYFNEDKYHLPMQCEKVDDIPAKRAEYEAYRAMVNNAKRKFDEEARSEGEIGKQELMKKMQNVKPGDQLSKYSPPFTEFANAMLFDLKRRMERGDADRISRAQQDYHDRIKSLYDEWKEADRKADGCGARIGLANSYMEKMAIEARTYQKVYLHIYKDFYNDNAFWTFFTTNNAHMRRALFCRLTSGMLSVLLQLAETHFLEVSLDCATDEKEKKDPDEMKIEGNCPLNESGIEIPFVIGKYNVNCEETSFEIGELIILNVTHKFSTGETIWAIGPGAALSLIGHSEESKIQIPALGPITPGLSAGIKGQVFWTFKDGQFMEWGGLIETELDVLGWGKEIKTNVSIGSVSGLQMSDGLLKQAIDDNLGPPKEQQMNKDIKIYKSN